MFTVIKRMEISASHKLVLPYRSKCASLHGHNWIITVYCRSARLNSEGMVVDFTRIKQIPQCYKVEVQESEGNIVIYEKEPSGAEGQE